MLEKVKFIRNNIFIQHNPHDVLARCRIRWYDEHPDRKSRKIINKNHNLINFLFTYVLYIVHHIYYLYNLEVLQFKYLHDQSWVPHMLYAIVSLEF